jgi:hypothetical protein
MSRKKVVAPIEYSRKAITPINYSGLQSAFDNLDRVLFRGELPDVFIAYQRRAHSGEYFSPEWFADCINRDQRYEIALNPDGFIGRTNEFIISILLHENGPSLAANVEQSS